ENMHLPPEVLKHCLKAVRAHIETLEALVKQHEGDLPEDFEPNDISMYKSLEEGLARSTTDGLEVSNMLSKPIRFMMALIPLYVRNSRSIISLHDYNALFRSYCEFRLNESLELMSRRWDLPDTSGLGAKLQALGEQGPWGHRKLSRVKGSGVLS